MNGRTEPSVIVDFCACYIVGIKNMQPGWYFWFIDQYQRVVSAAIGPFTLDEVYRAGKIAVLVYYDE